MIHILLLLLMIYLLLSLPLLPLLDFPCSHVPPLSIEPSLWNRLHGESAFESGPPRGKKKEKKRKRKARDILVRDTTLITSPTAGGQALIRYMYSRVVH